MMKRILSIAAVVIIVGTLSASTATAGKKSSFGVTASSTGNCTVTATATWSGARVLEVDYVLSVDTATYTAQDALKKAQRSGTSSAAFTVTNAGTGMVTATFLTPKKATAGTAMSSAFPVSCT